MRKKLLVLILSVLMVFSMAVPSFAATCNTRKPILLSFGDSIGVGFANDGRHMDFIQFKDGVKNHSFSEAPTVMTSYPALVAKKLGGIDEENSYNDVFNGLRAKDLCYFLGLIDEDEYYTTVGTERVDENGNKYISNKDVFSVFVMQGTDLFKQSGMGKELDDMFAGLELDLGDQLNDVFAQFIVGRPGEVLGNERNVQDLKAAISTADIITVELGFNDFTAMTMNKIGDLFDGMMGAVSELGKIGEFKDLIEQYKNGTTYTEKMCVICQMMDKLGKMGVDVINDIKIIDKATSVAVKESTKYLDMFMKYIRSENKKAKIATITIYNPMTNFDFENAFSMMGSDLGMNFDMDLGIDLGIDMSAINPAKILEIMLQPYVDKANNNILKKAKRFNYRVADIRGKVQPMSDNIFHPDEKGQEKMADIIVVALSKYKVRTAVRLAKEECSRCKHVNTEIQGAVDATLINKGYTGDKVCLDCGEVLAKGTETDMLTLEGTAIKKLSKSCNSITAKWNEVSDIDGYRIQCSTSSEFSKNVKKINVKSSATTSHKIEKLNSGKKYYVRIRTYKNVDGVNVYSGWSETVSVKTK